MVTLQAKSRNRQIDSLVYELSPNGDKNMG